MKAGNIYDKIYESFLSDIKNGDTELADLLLIDLGYDLKEINELAEKIYERQRLILDELILRQRQEIILDKTSSLISLIIKKRDLRILDKLNEILRLNKIIFQQENLKNLTVDEIKEMIRNVNYTELLTQLEEENE
jgi:hypothetical protein